jgi:DEAD/DEAH box helicase domain-containing protein
MYKDRVHKLLLHWQSDLEFKQNIKTWVTKEAETGSYVSIPDEIDQRLIASLSSNGIQMLYSHQAMAWERLRNRENVVVVTGTASGKSLCYNLPVLNELLSNPDSSALYIFPTKALANDQANSIRALINNIKGVSQIQPAIYDGDTPSSARSWIRSNARLILTNPDMLHLGILPHHTSWERFFRNLRFIIVDEIHTYRGVFGSHVANVIRRLKRITAFYNATPLFIQTSATINNPGNHAQRFIDDHVTLIQNDGAPKGKRNYILYNPPIINQRTGIRARASIEALRISEDTTRFGVQTIVFTQTRQSVERMLKDYQGKTDQHNGVIRGYRSGYLPSQRRSIESALKAGTAQVVISTNALELGVDIGSMGASILVGYPGSIASTKQEWGRAGRKGNESVAVLVASANPLDQYLVKHPEYLFEQNPENALINPDNLAILTAHIQCAAFELPFKKPYHFGSIPQAQMDQILVWLTQSGLLHEVEGSFYWSADQYPSSKINLRSSSTNIVTLHVHGEAKDEILGTVDQESSYWMVHPGAIYLHEGKTYRVAELDIEQKFALLTQFDPDYFTEDIKQVNINILQEMNMVAEQGCQRSYGEIEVNSKVVGYRKLNWYTHENLGVLPLEMPETLLRTYGYWFVLNGGIIEKLKQLGLWSGQPNNYGPNWEKQRELARRRDCFRCQICGTPELKDEHHVHHLTPFRSFTTTDYANRLENLMTLCPVCHKRVEEIVRMRSGLAGVAYAIQHLASLIVMCDRADIGIHFDPQFPTTGQKPTIIIYDQFPGGIGLSETLFNQHNGLIFQVQQLVSGCECEDGCPGCVGPAGENGAGGKQEAIELLNLLTMDKLDD